MKAYVFLFTLLGIGFVGVLGVAADIPQAREDNRIADSLAAQKEAIFARAAAKNQIVEDVIAGRLTLASAADKFGELNRKNPESMTAMRFHFTGDTDHERLCRQVIHRVKVALEDRSTEEESLIPRLESEMEKYLSEHAPGA